jgi:excisionase family DNA binding protein
MNEPLLISFQSASELLGISRATLYTLHADGRLGPMVHKIGRRSLLNRKELERWTDAGMPPRSQWNGSNHGG